MQSIRTRRLPAATGRAFADRDWARTTPPADPQSAQALQCLLGLFSPPTSRQRFAARSVPRIDCNERGRDFFPCRRSLSSACWRFTRPRRLSRHTSMGGISTPDAWLRPEYTGRYCQTSDVKTKSCRCCNCAKPCESGLIGSVIALFVGICGPAVVSGREPPPRSGRSGTLSATAAIFWLFGFVMRYSYAAEGIQHSLEWT